MSDHDLVVRNGTLVDGSGGKPRRGDVAIDGERIAAVGDDVGTGHREIDAEGHLVTPGFVDIHTHYDAQATWDPYLSPSSQHGVTSVVMGNCGVGFAPVNETLRNELIELMEAVEDIPAPPCTRASSGSGRASRSSWRRSSVARTPSTSGVQVPHCALRAYVMGQRGIDNEKATARTSRAWPSWCARRSAPAPWASPRRARSSTTRSKACPCRHLRRPR